MCMWEPRMGKILVWVGADVTPTTGHQRFSAGNTPGECLSQDGVGMGATTKCFALKPGSESTTGNELRRDYVM